jgi:hypothetical protein
MAEKSKENPDQLSSSAIRLNRWLELAVPLFSFGGILIAFFLLGLGNNQSYRIASYGCIIGSFILAYLAWIRPKKDIVSLTTPLYAVILFVLPSDLIPDMILPILYAVSLTILLVRLKYRFGEPGTAVSLGKELGGSLKTYVDRTCEPFKHTSPDTAHRASLAFVQFSQGDYAKVAKMSDTQPVQEDTAGFCLSRAFKVVQEHAALLDTSRPRPDTYQVFTPECADLLANPMLPGKDDDHEFYHTLDNALLLLFSVSWNGAEQDHPHLLRLQAFAQKLMSSE